MHYLAVTITYPGPQVESTAQLMTIVFGVLGAIAAIVIILAALRMIISGGANPQEVAKTKNAIIYAAIGLAVSLLAVAIIQLVNVITA